MSVLLEVNGINVTFDGFKAINNLSLSISNNELRAIIGPNGAGKTTFMDIVTGKTKPDSGTILWGQKNSSLLRMSEVQIVELGISRKFQKPTLIETQSVFENLLLSLKKSRNPIATLFYKMSPDDEYRVRDLLYYSCTTRSSSSIWIGRKGMKEAAGGGAVEPPGGLLLSGTGATCRYLGTAS